MSDDFFKFERRYSAKRVNPDFYGEVKVLDAESPRREDDRVEFIGEKPRGWEKKKPLVMKTVRPDFEPGYVYAPYVPLQKSPSVVRRTPGRFPRLAKVRDDIIPPVGTLVRATTGDKQFGIVGQRGEKLGVFWSSDGWIDDYEEGELATMFGNNVEVVL